MTTHALTRHDPRARRLAAAVYSLRSLTDGRGLAAHLARRARWGR